MPRHQFRIEVAPAYLAEQSSPEQGIYGFSYTITITNSGDIAAQVIARHWLITHGDGGVEEVKGLGVVGHQPLLAPGQSFQYTSGCRLRTPTGTMHGNFFCVGEDGERFNTPIDAFVLDAGGPRTLH